MNHYFQRNWSRFLLFFFSFSSHGNCSLDAWFRIPFFMDVIIAVHGDSLSFSGPTFRNIQCLNLREIMCMLHILVICHIFKIELLSETNIYCQRVELGWWASTHHRWFSDCATIVDDAILQCTHTTFSMHKINFRSTLNATYVCAHTIDFHRENFQWLVARRPFSNEFQQHIIKASLAVELIVLLLLSLAH